MNRRLTTVLVPLFLLLFISAGIDIGVSQIRPLLDIKMDWRLVWRYTFGLSFLVIAAAGGVGWAINRNIQ